MLTLILQQDFVEHTGWHFVIQLASRLSWNACEFHSTFPPKGDQPKSLMFLSWQSIGSLRLWSSKLGSTGSGDAIAIR